MPIHDWSRGSAGLFHDFHLCWVARIWDVVNNGVLPPDHYAMIEQTGGDLDPFAATIDNAMPRMRFTAQTELDAYLLRRRTLVIRHDSDDRIIALVEIVSPGNKSSRHALRSFVDKATEALYRGYHLLIVDLHPPGRRDPQGIHGAIWSAISDDNYSAPTDKPLTLAAYSAGTIKRAFIETGSRGRHAAGDAAVSGAGSLRQRAAGGDLPGGVSRRADAVEAGGGRSRIIS